MYEVSKQRCKGMLLSSRKVELLIYTDEDGTHIKIDHCGNAVGWDFKVFYKLLFATCKFTFRHYYGVTFNKEKLLEMIHSHTAAILNVLEEEGNEGVKNA